MGEAALIGAGGSILGVGSDVAGSLRIPAHFSGVFGLKPSTGRIYESGRRGGVGSEGLILRTGIYSVAGFMSSSVAGLEIGMRALLQECSKMSALDWRVAPVDWNETKFKPGRNLKVGYYLNDGWFPPTPGIKRALQEVIRLLTNAGHEVVLWTPPNASDIVEIGANFLFADRGHFFMRTMEDEVIDQAIEVNTLVMTTPGIIKSCLSLLFRPFSQHICKMWRTGLPTTQDQWLENAKKDRLIYEFMKSWEDNDFDVVLCPPFAMPACEPKYCSRLMPGSF